MWHTRRESARGCKSWTHRLANQHLLLEPKSGRRHTVQIEISSEGEVRRRATEANGRVVNGKRSLSVEREARRARNNEEQRNAYPNLLQLLGLHPVAARLTPRRGRRRQRPVLGASTRVRQTCPAGLESILAKRVSDPLDGSPSDRDETSHATPTFATYPFSSRQASHHEEGSLWPQDRYRDHLFFGSGLHTSRRYVLSERSIPIVNHDLLKFVAAHTIDRPEMCP